MQVADKEGRWPHPLHQSVGDTIQVSVRIRDSGYNSIYLPDTHVIFST